MPYSIGIDLGGTSIKLIAASDSGGHLLMMYDRLSTEPLYGGVLRAFLRLLDTPRVRVATH